MFEGRNEIKFSKATAQKIVGEYLSKLFGVPINVTDLTLGDYHSTVDVTFEETTKTECKPETDTL